MFSHRRNSQKPNDDLYASFKQNFPDVGPGTSSAGPGELPALTQRSASLSEALIDAPSTQRYVFRATSPQLSPPHRHIIDTTTMSIMTPDDDELKPSNELVTDYFARPFDSVDDGKDVDATPKPFGDSWRLTPSLMDPNSFAFAAFANQPPGYYTPTPGGFNTLYHSQAGDLHTPGMGMNTPLSLPHSIHGLHAHETNMHLQHFNPQMLHHPQMFQDPFSHHQQQQQHQQQQSFAPHAFLQHQDSGYVAMDESPHKTTPQPNELMLAQSQSHPSVQRSIAGTTQAPSMPMGDKYAMAESAFMRQTNTLSRFRFHTTLNAPTAMIKHSDEIPITYLNKGQAYTVSIFDTRPPGLQATPVRYRTFVRVSFEDEQQRARPGSCWQLWKEGRGSNEAHQRGGKLLAVEYVDPNQGGDDATRKSQVELESASFDGFAVTWYPNPSPGVPDCSISVRFNFLSTDFSHSKGVKGIPVRLCAKTELLAPEGASINEPEVCFSKVKLFRDHGAERKLSNDVAHVKKTIEKLKQQISQAEAGLGGSGKRKRSGSTVKPGASKPGKVLKHKRTWSVDSDVELGRSAAEEDLHMKLINMQDMFSSTRPVSVLYLQGEPEDDPDLHPVKLSGGDVVESDSMTRTETWDSRPSIESPGSNGASPSSSSASQVTPKRKYSEMQQSTIYEEGEDVSTAGSRPRSPDRPVKIPKLESEAQQSPELLALDVDKSYQPPTEPPIKPGKINHFSPPNYTNRAAVACFYVRQRDDGKEYYRAVYLFRRTVRDLVNGISQKFQIDPQRVTQVTHVNSKGLHIIVDEDVVREVPEGQDMLVEFAPGGGEHVKQEFASQPITEAMVDGIIEPVNTAVSDPLEMWLNY